MKHIAAKPKKQKRAEPKSIDTKVQSVEVKTPDVSKEEFAIIKLEPEILEPKPKKKSKLEKIVSYIKTDKTYNPSDLETKAVQSDVTFDKRLYEHLEGLKALELDERGQLVVWRMLNPALVLFYEKMYKFMYDGTRINMATEVRLS